MKNQQQINELVSNKHKNLIICSKCGGDGWYTDHSDLHYTMPELSCIEAGCPVQRVCETCKGTGKC